MTNTRTFPDTDPKFKGADSLVLLSHCGKLVREKGYRINNIDATIVAQRPKMAPHIQTMRENIARALEIEINQVNVKATTEEKLGFTGTEQGISSYAAALIEN